MTWVLILSAGLLVIMAFGAFANANASFKAINKTRGCHSFEWLTNERHRRRVWLATGYITLAGAGVLVLALFTSN